VPYNDSLYKFNLVDTPGHVDFSFEVKRTLYAVEGVVLLVDAMKGIQAQTISNYEQALACRLKVIPVINKIDMQMADPDSVCTSMQSLFGFKADEVLRVSAKSNLNIDLLKNAIIDRLNPPDLIGIEYAKILIFDS